MDVSTELEQIFDVIVEKHQEIFYSTGWDQESDDGGDDADETNPIDESLLALGLRN